MNLGTAFDPRDNALTPMRLMLALLVVYSHGFVTAGMGRDPLYQLTDGHLQLGTVAVVSFFGLSGFLLAGSRLRSPLREFARNRALRIMPGLLVCLAFVALLVVPIAVALGGTADPGEVVAFVVGNATFNLVPPQIHGLFPGQEFPDQPDLSLWSLAPEVWCYAALALIPQRVLKAAALELLLLACAVNVLTGGGSLYLHLPVAFLTGATLYAYRDRIPMSPHLPVGMLMLLAVALTVNWGAMVAPVVLPYVALWLGIRLPLRWSRDLSYGTYIYAWPIQQLAGVSGLAAFGLLVFDAVTVVIVLVLAYARARFIEEPAMRLGRRDSKASASHWAPSTPRASQGP